MALTRQNKDSQSNPEEEYTALLRSLRWTEGFGLLFVQCSPAEGDRIIDQVRQDLPQKQIEVLSLKDPIDNLYNLVDALPNKDHIDVLFIQGIEHSLYDYEKTQLWDNPIDHYTYSEKNVPRLLGHLNFSRERFRDNFNICFVFLVPLFALKYLIRRAPDFFDWRSGAFKFSSDAELVAQRSFQIVQEGDYEKYLSWTQAQRDRKISEIQSWIDEQNQTSENKSGLFLQLGSLLDASKKHEIAIAQYNQSINFRRDNPTAWISIGDALLKLGRYQEAVDSYDHALKIEPTIHAGLLGRSISLFLLDRYQEGIASLDRALAVNPHDSSDWYLRGRLLKLWGKMELYKTVLRDLQKLNRDASLTTQNLDDVLAKKNPTQSTKQTTSLKEELQTLADTAKQAEASKQKAQENLMLKLIEAISCFDNALEIQPYHSDAYYEKAGCYGLQGQVDDTIATLKQAINLDLECREKAKTDADFYQVRSDDRFQVLLKN